jgi:hypothetical protein
LENKFELELFNGSMRIKRDKTNDPTLISDGKKPPRGNISGFSDKARARMLKTVNQINRPDPPLFITLTYRDNEQDHSKSKKHLDRIRKHFEYKYKQIAAIWRLEFQRRGAIHYHILLWKSDTWLNYPLDEVKETVSKAWAKIILDGSEATLKYSVKIMLGENSNALSLYLLGHNNKTNQIRDDLETGRYWGIWKKELLGIGKPQESYNIKQNQIFVLRRLSRQYLIKTGKCKENSRMVKMLKSRYYDYNFDLLIPKHQQCRIVRFLKNETIPTNFFIKLNKTENK